MKTSTPYLTTLTPLRGIAALLVVIFHSNLMLAPFMDETKTKFVQSGWLWVDFFFVLSGFVLSHAYGAYFQETVSWGGYKKYLLARFARVYPLHFLTLWAAVAVILVIRSMVDGLDPFFQIIFGLHTIPASLLLVQSLHLYGTAPLNTPSWSLSTEWWIYVIFPLLVRPFFRLNGLGKLLTLAGIAGLFLGLMYYVVPHYSDTPFDKPGVLSPPTINTLTDWGLIRCLAGFLLGMLFYELYRSRWASSLLKSGWAFLTFTVGVCVAMHFGIHELLILAFFPFIILTAAYNSDFVKQALDTRPLQRLGDCRAAGAVILNLYGPYSYCLRLDNHFYFAPESEDVLQLRSIRYDQVSAGCADVSVIGCTDAGRCGTNVSLRGSTSAELHQSSVRASAAGLFCKFSRNGSFPTQALITTNASRALCLSIPVRQLKPGSPDY